jgi:hypothetical protein
LPLSSKGPISYLPVRYPTDEELDTCLQFDLTSADNWTPSCLDGIDGGSIFSLSSFSSESAYSPSYEMEYLLLHNDIAELLNDRIYIHAMRHSSSKDITPEFLSDLWNISLEAAKRTLQSTTHDSIRILRGRIHRRVKTRAHQNRYKQLGGYTSSFCSDTFKSHVRSIRGNKYVQLFCNKGLYVRCYPMKQKGHAHYALDRFIHEVGIPTEILTDGAKELILSEWGRICRKHSIQQVTTEPHSPWQNPAESTGGMVKRKVRDVMKRTNTPIRLWDYCWEHQSAIKSLTASSHPILDGVTPFEKVHGYTPNIAEYIVYKWYQWVWYHDPDTPDKSELGRWLGPSHNIGQGLAHHILSRNGKVVTRSTVHSLSMEDLQSNEIKERMDLHTKTVESLIGNYTQATLDNCDDKHADDPYASMFESDDLDNEDIDPMHDESFKPDVDDIKEAPFNEIDDKYIGMKVDLPHLGEMKEGTVRRRKRTADGNLVGTANSNPIRDTRVYEVDFGDGTYQDYSTNVLVENLYSHIDDEGRSHSLLDAIVDHQSDDDAVDRRDGLYRTPSGAMKKRITTKGWKIKIQWKNGTASWVPLADVKESNPVELAEYAYAKKLDKEPAFAWWVGHTLRKRDRIVNQVKHRMIKKELKFGIQVPRSVDEALKLDKENDNDLWQKAIDKELKNVLIAFQLLEEGESLPVGSKEIPYHIIFDVKFDLTRKARLVAGGHRAKHLVPAHAKFSSVASRDSIRICLMLAALNDLDVLSADVGNAYLNAPCREKVHVKCGPELFGAEHAGKCAVIVRALYGLCSSGAAWRSHFAHFIKEELGYTSSIADPDVHMKPRVKSDGSKYYAYRIVFVDDVISIDHNPKESMDMLGTLFRLKGSVEKPNLYLGTDIRKWNYERDDGTNGKCWALGSRSYLKEAVKVAEAQMKKHNLSYSSSRRQGRNVPFSSVDYRPELDNSPVCDETHAKLYQNFIGVLRWTCELGRVDILHETSIMSQYLAQPRMGHLQQVLNIFCYLKHHDRSWMVMNPTSFDVDWTPNSNEPHPLERAQSMKEIYTDAEEELPQNMPPPRGEPVDISVFVDADHAGNRVTRRSHTGILLYCNLAPVIWYSKRQNTVETSTFGSEFVALRICTELIESLRYKLRMFGVPVPSPARVFCDNEAVVKSSSFPESTLKKKHCSIAYHRVREAIAAEKLLVYHEKTDSNLADLFTKILPGHKRLPLVQAILA